MKTKIFKFQEKWVSSDEGVSITEMEAEINEFIKNKKVISCSHAVRPHPHNPDLHFFTIIYEEQKS